MTLGTSETTHGTRRRRPKGRLIVGGLVSVTVLAVAAAVIAVFAAVAPSPEPVSAASFIVNDTGDASDDVHGNGACATSGGVCTLRAAIQEANALAGTHSISFAGGGTIELGSGLPTIDKALTITGPGAGSLTVDGNDTETVFTISAGGTPAVTIAHLTVTAGDGVSGGAIFNSEALTLTSVNIFNNSASFGGGGIFNSGGTLTVTDSTLADNTSAGSGGAIFNDAAGTVTITGSTLSGNSATLAGGAVHNQDGPNAGASVVTATNTTFSGNSADGSGGAIQTTGGADEAIALNNVTITENVADDNNDGTGNGGGIQRFSGTVTMKNTILYGNSDLGGQAPDCGGSVTSDPEGHNIVGTLTGCGYTSISGDWIGIDPLLGDLQDNGGPTETHALSAPASIAIDAGTDPDLVPPVTFGCPPPSTDQRGFTRPTDGDGDTIATCDIGAYEAAANTPKPGVGGNLSGIYDVLIHSGTKSVGLYHCIARLDHDVSTDDVKMAAQCYGDTPGVNAEAYPATADLIPGPPPPPPYSGLPPTKLNGNYDDDQDALYLAGCFADLGGALGPNIIAFVALGDSKADLLATGKITGTVYISDQQSVEDCDETNVPKGGPALAINLVPAAGTPVAESICSGAVDDDGDGKVNDGCLQVGSTSETLAQCNNAVNDDLGDDSLVNDGCPADGGVPWRSSTTDFDGDGCTDFQELDKTGLYGNCGDDPYNPHDSDLDLNGPIEALATVARADVCHDNGQPAPACTGKPNGTKVPGSYFYCIGNLEHDTGTNDMEADAQCVMSSPASEAASGSGVPAQGKGEPYGNPPPFKKGAPSKFKGALDPGTKKASLKGCFKNVAQPLGPNVIAEVKVDARSGQGTVDVWFKQSKANCEADPPTPVGSPAINDAKARVSAQPKDAQVVPWESGFTPWDSDGDGCSDKEEVEQTDPTCGDDPMNGEDSDASIQGNDEILVTIAEADACAGGLPAPACTGKFDGTLVPGVYFHCITSVVHNPGNSLVTKAYCYQDNPGLTVNPQAVPAPNAGAGTCPPAPAAQCGDGLPDAPPPGTVFGDVDGTHAEFSGAGNSYNKGTGKVHIEGCFQNVDGPTGPNVYIRAVIDANTGEGTVDIWVQEASCAKPGGDPDIGDINDAKVSAVTLKDTTGLPAQMHNDKDKDGCTDTQELRNTQATGGRRDPFNRWDLEDQWIGGTRDRVVSGGDIGVVVARFGTIGSPAGDPLVPPTGPGYHTSSDRAGGLPGSNSWNLRPPDGSVSGGDIGAVVAQFGHSCAM
jgi:CSLREA domain-containing protein